MEKDFTHPMVANTLSLRHRKGKFVSAEEAVSIVRDGDVVATGGFIGAGFAEEVAVQLEERIPSPK